MVPHFTDDQPQALDAEGGVFILDEKRRVTYVLVSAHDFQRVHPLFDEEGFPIRESYSLRAMPEIAAS